MMCDGIEVSLVNPQDPICPSWAVTPVPAQELWTLCSTDLELLSLV